MKETEYLLDSSVWNERYLDNTKANWAIGGATLELLVASYEKYDGNKIIIEDLNEYGYRRTISEGLTNNKGNGIYNHNYSYWLACPCNGKEDTVRFVHYENESVDNYYGNTESGIRPVVCLRSNIKLKLNDDKISYSIE